jgi:hypothetical protein
VYPDPNTGGCYLKFSRKPSREQKFFAKTFAKTKVFAKTFAKMKILREIFCENAFRENEKRVFVSTLSDRQDENVLNPPHSTR